MEDKKEIASCYCGGTLQAVALVTTLRHKELQDQPNWPIDDIATRSINQCEKCARLFLDSVLLVPWHRFGDERAGCPRCGSEKDLIIDEGRFVCLNPQCAYCWADRTRNNPKNMKILRDERTKLVEVLAEFASDPTGSDFTIAVERFKRVKNQIELLGKEQL